MGVSVLILGHSGTGKSTSLRNFDEGEIGIFNIAGKPLPFRKKLTKLDKALYNQIHGSLAKNAMRAYVIDDANYLMAFQNFRLAKQTGYGKFTDMAVNFEQLLEAANDTNDNTIVYFMMHPDYDDAGRMKAKTIGKMLDNQLTIEGMFPIVLLADRDDSGFHFITQSDGMTPVKTPMGMFDEAVIDNDLKYVDAVIRDYWGMEPLTSTDGGE
jgi:hypothetical protein